MEEVLSANDQAFTLEQTEYLRGFWAGVKNRLPVPFVGETAGGQFTSEAASGVPNLAAEPEFFGTPVDELCREEKWKYDANPLDAWDELVAHAQEDRPPDAEHTFRFKFFGLFYVAPAQESFMLRMRMPGCVLRADQLRGLAEMAANWGDGGCAVTTRGNLQIRDFAPRHIVDVLTKLDALGISSKGSGADNVRNITATPTTGLDPQELMEVAPLAKALEYYIRNSRDLYGLPRKFNVAFDSGGSISVVSDTNDIGFVAVRVAEGKSVPAGVYFRVLLCGITGHRQFASDAGILVPAGQTVALAAAMIRVFAEHGDRTDRKKARLKYLVDRWGVEQFLSETEKKLAFPLLRFDAAECEPRGLIEKHGHLGVHPQSQPGLNYLGVVTPVGKLTAAQMVSLAEIAERFGTGEMRLTVWQNVLIPNVANAHVDAVKAALEAAALHWSASTIMGGVIACTGNKGCKFSQTDTKAHALILANHLDARFKLEQPVNLHVTGCPNSCAQHYIGDIGLMGVKVGGEEGYGVYLGGGADHEQGIARELIPAIKFTELPPVMEKLFGIFEADKREGESFLEFSRRSDIVALREAVTA